MIQWEHAFSAPNSASTAIRKCKSLFAATVLNNGGIAFFRLKKELISSNSSQVIHGTTENFVASAPLERASIVILEVHRGIELKNEILIVCTVESHEPDQPHILQHTIDLRKGRSITDVLKIQVTVRSNPDLHGIENLGKHTLLKDVVKFPVNLITSSSIRINTAQSAVLRPWQLVQIIKSINVEVVVRLFLFLFLFNTWFMGHLGLFLNII